uniref:Cathepsin B n=1 Tax=Cacopsylla melanoneura TaxID=428564 RepID=A0A8D8M3V1_9HEMI
MWTVGLISLILCQALAFHIPQVKYERLSVPLHDIVTLVNTNVTSTWKAGHNFHPETPASYLRSLMGTLPLDESNPDLKEFVAQVKHNEAEFAQAKAVAQVKAARGFSESDEEDLETMGCENAKGLPRNFDARQKWPQCPSIGHIVDQSNCGSCWAVSVATAISDRLCIASNGFFQGHISSQHLLSCTKRTGGCQGGWPQLAWKHWGHNGVVTGGDYNSRQGCQPYAYPPCEHHTEGPLANCSTLEKFATTECKQHCVNPNYEATYHFDVTDLQKGKKAHMVPRCNAMKHIYEHGPIVGIFGVYEDFLQYKSGVYQHNFGEMVGLHAVKVLGWGIEDGTPYWLIANSWNGHWGDKGTFKILRGENEVNIEMGFNAGYPHFVRV